MHLTAPVSFTLAALISTAVTLAIEPRGLPGAVYTCNLPLYSGSCGWQPPSSSCRINGGVQSIGPDQGGYCTLYKGSDCNSKEQIKTIVYPGLGLGIGDFGSMKCAPFVSPG